MGELGAACRGRHQKGLLHVLPDMLRYVVKQRSSSELCLAVVIGLRHRKLMLRIAGIAQVLIDLFQRFQIPVPPELQ